MNSDIAPRPAETGLSGHYEPSAPGATSLRDARALYIGGKHVTAEVHGRTVTVFIGTLIAFTGELPGHVTQRGQVNGWVAEHALEIGEPVKAHRYGDPCKTCGKPAYDYNTPKCDQCRRSEERAGTDRLSQLYTPGKAQVLAEMREAGDVEPTDADAPVVLDVEGYGEHYVSFRARFATEAQALAYMDAHAQYCYAESEPFPVPDACERLITRLYPLCEHNMSLALCYGPDHYASPEEIAQGW